MFEDAKFGFMILIAFLLVAFGTKMILNKTKTVTI